MSLRTKCPHCEREAVLVAEALGKNVRCKGCSKTFTARPPARVGSDPEMRVAVKAGAATATKTRIRPLADRDQDDDDPPTRFGQREESKTTLWIGLAAIGLVTIVASMLEFVLIVNRHPRPQAFAQEPPPPMPPPVQQAAVEPPPVKAAPIVVAQPNVAATPKDDPRPKADPVIEPPPQPPQPPRPVQVANGPPGLYGTQGNEEIGRAAADPHTVPRARAEDSFFRLSNPRVTPLGPNPRGKFEIDFQVVQRGKLSPSRIMMHYAGDRNVPYGGITLLDKDQGTLTVSRNPHPLDPLPERTSVLSGADRLRDTAIPPGVFKYVS